jgi:hypothetical protein
MPEPYVARAVAPLSTSASYLSLTLRNCWPVPPFRGANVRSNVLGLRDTMLDYFNLLRRLGRELHCGFTLGLGIRVPSRLDGWPMRSLPTLRSCSREHTRTARADVDRTSFIAVDLRHLLLAGLPAHSP